MRYYIATLLLLLIIPFANAKNGIKYLEDSLENRISNNLDFSPAERLNTIRNAMDISRETKRQYFSRLLYTEAMDLQDVYYSKTGILSCLAYAINQDQSDSINYYVSLIKKVLKDEKNKMELDFILTYAQTLTDVRYVYFKQGDETSSIINRYQMLLENEKTSSDLEKISAHYFMGMYYTTLKNSFNKSEINDKIATEYKKAIHLLKQYPIEISSPFLKGSYSMICDFLQNKKEKLEYTLEYKDFEETSIDLAKKKGRKYFSYRRIIEIYALLAKNVEVLGTDSATLYYNKFVELNNRYPNESVYPYAYNHNHTSFWHYFEKKDYKKALEFCDPLINYLRSNGDNRYDWNMILSATANKIECLDSLGCYKKAFIEQKTYIALLDTVRKRNMEEKIQETETNKQLEELLVQKSELEVDLQSNKKQLYLSLAFFLIAIAIAIFVCFRLDKINRLYKTLKNTNIQLKVATKKAQEGERAKNTFIRNICHEVRTPLNAVNGFSELILNPDIPAEDKEEFSRIIFDSCRNITTMMDDLLTISLLDNDYKGLSLETIHIDTICRNELDTLIKLQKKNSIEYLLEGDPTNDLAYTNKHYFTMIISHLLRNANKFTSQGKIVLSYAILEEKQQMLITVSDTGCGIPENKKDWIFDRFTKSDDFSQGSGLGLYVCRLIAKKMKAQIYLDTNNTTGSRFVLLLPLPKEQDK